MNRMNIWKWFYAFRLVAIVAILTVLFLTTSWFTKFILVLVLFLLPVYIPKPKQPNESKGSPTNN